MTVKSQVSGQPVLADPLGRIYGRIASIGPDAFGEGNELLVIAVRTEAERIISEEWAKSARSLLRTER